jgi:phytoene dehydrogenase-like protein
MLSYIQARGEMTEPSVIIVGAGIGGLSAGCYARLNGYRTQIFERHNKPGGVCTSWQRKDYTFDGCMHHLAGCSANSPINRLWQELGAMPRPIYYPEDLICIEGTNGRRFTVYIDLDRLHEHMLELAPADAAVTGEFIAAARAFTRFSMMDMLLAKPWQMLGMLPHLGLLGKWGKVTLEQFAQRFSDPFLRRAFPMIQYDFPDVPMLVLLMFLAGCSTHHLGWPAGGSLEFVRSIERRYLELGGEIHYGARVESVLVESGPKGDRAVGVRLADGTEQRAGAVISNADGHTTIYCLLGGRYTTPQIDAYYEQAPAEQVMSLHVSLGVARDLSAEPHALVLWLPEPVRIGDKLHDRLDLEFYAFAPEMAPAGKTVVKAHFPAAYAYWRGLRDQGAAYNEEKQRIAEAVIARLDRRFPGLAQQVEAVDVATPLTTERYVGSYHGLQAWPVPNQSVMDVLTGKGLSRTLPGLQRFWMAGQWAAGLGLPNVAAVGRRTVEAICKADGRRFVTTA